MRDEITAAAGGVHASTKDKSNLEKKTPIEITSRCGMRECEGLWLVYGGLNWTERVIKGLQWPSEQPRGTGTCQSRLPVRPSTACRSL